MFKFKFGFGIEKIGSPIEDWENLFAEDAREEANEARSQYLQALESLSREQGFELDQTVSDYVGMYGKQCFEDGMRCCARLMLTLLGGARA